MPKGIYKHHKHQGYQKGHITTAWNKGLTLEDPRVQSYAENRKRRITKICRICGSSYEVILSQSSKSKYCSRECYGKARSLYMSGKDCPSYKRGFLIDKNGYRRLLISKSHKRYVLEHRLVMERSIGRKLADGEVVHHIDRNRLNNDISNLELMTLSEHTKMHMTERRLSGAYEKFLK